uniref:Uncharacterized protein n=1 Tax=Salix viminalis TaxID=40686 RepID=A0A6N2M2N4_SALVM
MVVYGFDSGRSEPAFSRLLAWALANPYFKGLAKVEREPFCQPITKLEFEFERRRVTKEDVRELLYREILEYHPRLLKDYLNGNESTNFLYPSAIGQFRKQFAYLEENCGRSAPVISREEACLPSMQSQGELWDQLCPMRMVEISKISIMQGCFCRNAALPPQTTSQQCFFRTNTLIQEKSIAEAEKDSQTKQQPPQCNVVAKTSYGMAMDMNTNPYYQPQTRKPRKTSLHVVMWWPRHPMCWGSGFDLIGCGFRAFGLIASF